MQTPPYSQAEVRDRISSAMQPEFVSLNYRLSELARLLDCFTELEVCTLAGATPLTVEAWRKRHIGPDYVLFGNTFLYPRKELVEYLSARIRQMNVGVQTPRAMGVQRGKLPSVFESDLDE